MGHNMDKSMLELSFDYFSCVRSSERVAWRVEEALPDSARLDFARPFLPSALVGPDRFAFLSSAESLMLNQISGYAYLNAFQLVEEFILATMVQHAEAEMFGDRDALRALLRFADEEIKHQQLFARYMAAFARDGGYRPESLRTAHDVAGVVMDKTAVGVMLFILHIELMTLAHYVEAIREDLSLDMLFVRLMHLHWLEESQHARIDALELDKLLRRTRPEQIEQGLADYLNLIEAFDGLLRTQAEMDVRSLEGASGRALGEKQRTAVARSQHAGYRRTFLVLGMTNPTFLGHLRRVWPDGVARVREAAAALA